MGIVLEAFSPKAIEGAILIFQEKGIWFILLSYISSKGLYEAADRLCITSPSPDDSLSLFCVEALRSSTSSRPSPQMRYGADGLLKQTNHAGRSVL